MKPLIYTAGKLSDWPAKYIANMRMMMGYAHRIRRLNMAVAVPCLDFVMGLSHKMTIKEFMDNNLNIMLRCDAVALTPGWETSKGTIMEKEIAERYDIPILEDWKAVVGFANTHVNLRPTEKDKEIVAMLDKTVEEYN